jgi:hypothetical protein
VKKKKSDRLIARTFSVTFQLFGWGRNIGKESVSFLNFSANTLGGDKGGIQDACDSQNPESLQEQTDD